MAFQFGHSFEAVVELGWCFVAFKQLHEGHSTNRSIQQGMSNRYFRQLHGLTQPHQTSQSYHQTYILKIIVKPLIIFPIPHIPSSNCPDIAKQDNEDNKMALNNNLSNKVFAMQSKSRFKETSMGKYQTEDAWISDLDPILEGGFKVSFFEPQFALQIRRNTHEGHAESVKQLMNLRIMTLYGAQGLNQLKVQLSSQDDLFKLYICYLDAKKFERLRKQQHLNFNFDQLLPMLTKQINLCQKNINQYSAVFNMHKISSHRLDLLQNIEYKRIELLSLEFEEMDEEAVKNYVTFRFTKIKMNRQIVSKKLKDVMSMVKLKNQNLLTDILKKEKMKDESFRLSK